MDLACADAVRFNNTYFLEHYLDWEGLLFEPNARFHESIRSRRKSPLVTLCITDEAEKLVPFRIDNGMLGGIVSEETDNNEKNRLHELKSAEIVNMKTTTLEKELRQHSSPKLIDFLSLDVEGAEWIVLKDFPFDEYQFRCMAIERPNKKLDILLDSCGYRQVAHLSFDVIYVHKDFLQDMAWSPNSKFSFTPPKDW